MNQEILQVVKQSMKDNQKLLTALGNEKPVKLTRNPDDNILSLLNLLPTSTIGKIAFAGVIGLILYEILRTRD